MEEWERRWGMKSMKFGREEQDKVEEGENGDDEEEREEEEFGKKRKSA